MNDYIKKLKYTDHATKVMLNKLVEKKIAFEKHQLNFLILLSVTLVITLGFIIYIYVTVSQLDENLSIFTVLTSKQSNIYLFVILLGCYLYLGTFASKRDEAEEEFFALRNEIIDKSSDLWGDPEFWRNRHLDYQVLKDQFDINLYYESK